MPYDKSLNKMIKLVRSRWFVLKLLLSRDRGERSEVCTQDRGQDSPTQTEYARLIRCLFHGKQEKINLFDVIGLC